MISPSETPHAGRSDFDEFIENAAKEELENSLAAIRLRLQLSKNTGGLILERLQRLRKQEQRRAA
jgi:hypothetical protein